LKEINFLSFLKQGFLPNMDRNINNLIIHTLMSTKGRSHQLKKNVRKKKKIAAYFTHNKEKNLFFKYRSLQGCSRQRIQIICYLFHLPNLVEVEATLARSFSQTVAWDQSLSKQKITTTVAMTNVQE